MTTAWTVTSTTNLVYLPISPHISPYLPYISLLAMLTYDPMAMRAVSNPTPNSSPNPKPNQGRMQDLGRVPNLAGGVPNPNPNPNANPNQAMRARHGRMQGVPLEPLLLLTLEEVERHEAASAVQAASRGKAERQGKGSVQEQLEARANP